MEIILIIIICILVWIGYLFVRFTMFRSKLMNAFGSAGIPYDIADRIYTQQRNYINDLCHSDNYSPEEIVKKLIKENRLD
jgi:hypothetical protein